MGLVDKGRVVAINASGKDFKYLKYLYEFDSVLAYFFWWLSSRGRFFSLDSQNELFENHDLSSSLLQLVVSIWAILTTGIFHQVYIWEGFH